MQVISCIFLFHNAMLGRNERKYGKKIWALLAKYAYIQKALKTWWGLLFYEYNCVELYHSLDQLGPTNFDCGCV